MLSTNAGNVVWEQQCFAITKLVLSAQPLACSILLITQDRMFDSLSWVRAHACRVRIGCWTSTIAACATAGLVLPEVQSTLNPLRA